jgi:signal peptidase
MERVRQVLGWKKRSELEKTVILIITVVGITLSGFGIFTIAMGTSSPLVVVTSESMTPNLRTGDLLVIQKQAPENIVLGNIIVFYASFNDDPVVHRVVEIEVVGDEIHWYTKGDANSGNDLGYRTYDDIIGVVVFVVPYLGYVTLFLHEPLGFATVVVLLIIFLILPEFLVKGDKKEEEAADEASEAPTDSNSENP